MLAMNPVLAAVRTPWRAAGVTAAMLLASVSIAVSASLAVAAEPVSTAVDLGSKAAAFPNFVPMQLPTLSAE